MKINKCGLAFDTDSRATLVAFADLRRSFKLLLSSAADIHSRLQTTRPTGLEMKLLSSKILSLLSLSSVALAASWSFEDATLTVSGKGSGVGGGVKEK